MDVLTNTRGAVESDWLARWRRAPDAPMRLFCVPHAGGGTLAYRQWALDLAPGFDVVALRPPGREQRHREPAYDRLTELAAAVVREVTPLLDRSYAWFGHSLGALVAFEACRAIQAAGGPDPVRLLVSGRPAPDLVPRLSPVHAAPTPILMSRLREMGGTPPEILDDVAVMAGMLPTIRADLAAAETYTCVPAVPLNTPITAFGGRSDPFATVDELAAWGHHTHAGSRVRMFDGGHFYLHDRQTDFVSAVREELDGPAAHTPEARRLA
jgi:medium-chain acyl-[acyl-carrier-protein] hydrolase